MFVRSKSNTMEYYSAIKNNDFMKFIGKWMELENIILSEVTQSQKNTHGMHSLISGYYPKCLNYPIPCQGYSCSPFKEGVKHSHFDHPS